MPRKPRLHIPHGVYHVMLRGNDRQRIFFEADDYHCLEELFGRGLARYACRIHAYCWMPNHIHLAIQIEDRPLGALMQWVASQYARALNRHYRRSGHLFERRHRAIWVDADRYLLALVRYIHRNPVRAGIATDLADYPWSSHAAYLGLHDVAWLTTGLVRTLLGTTPPRQTTGYHRFMAQDELDDDTAGMRHGSADPRAFGTVSLHEQKVQLTGAALVEARDSLDAIVARYCENSGIAEATLGSAVRSSANAELRARIAVAAHQAGVASIATVARRFNRTESVLCRAIQRYNKS